MTFRGKATTNVCRMKSPQEVVDFSSTLVKAVEKATGHPLDTEPETLPILDYYCRLYRESRKGKPEGEVAAEGDGVGKLLAPMAGAYFGEVARKKFECDWHAPLQQYGLWRIQFKHCFLFFNPVAIALEVLSQQETVAWSSSYVTHREDEEDICSALDAWGPISRNDYYTFSIRWEILDLVSSRLTTTELLAKGVRGDGKVKVYSSRDYERYIKSLEE